MKNCLSAIALVVAAGVTITALLLPPQGEIDASVLYVVAQFLIFAGTLLGVESKMSNVKCQMSKKCQMSNVECKG